MRILNDFKIPNFKFKKIKMKDVENIEEVKVDYERLQKKQVIAQKRKQRGYETTDYKTIKEVFEMAREKYSDNIFMLEKFTSKGDFTEITYKEFADDVIALGTALTKKYNLKDVDFLKAGHHGSNTSSSEKFINSINPKYSLISVGKNNRYGHPKESVLDTLSNSKIYRTDIDGSIEIKLNKNGYKFRICPP